MDHSILQKNRLSTPSQIYKQPSTDNKTINIQCFLDFSREKDQLEVVKENTAATKLECKLNNQIKDIEIRELGVAKFDINTVNLGDRFIPLRCFDDNEDASDVLNTKVEIEHCPPCNWNLDAVATEPSEYNNHTNSQNQVNNVDTVANGENVKKYNILLQTQLLNIKNPHMIHNGFLNENSKINLE